MTTRPDAPVLLVGSYTEPDGDGGVLLCHVDQGRPVVAGRLALRNASWLEQLDDHHVLACSEQPTSQLVLLRHDGHRVVEVDRQPSGGSDACHLALSPDRRWVAVANYSSGSVALFTAPAGGRLAPPASLFHFRGGGPVVERQQAPHAHHCAWLDSQHLLVCDLGADMVHLLRVADAPPAPGTEAPGGGGAALAELEPIRLPPGSGPRHLVLRRGPGGMEVAVCTELSGEVFSLRHPAHDEAASAIATPRWSSGWELVDRVPASQLPGPATPSGIRRWDDQLVVANRGTRSITLLDWDRDGSLRRVAEHPCGGIEPRDLVVHDGQVWVANQESGEVVVLERRGAGLAQVARHRVGRPARLLFAAAR